MALQERGNGIRYDVAEVRGSLDTRLERRGLKVAFFFNLSLILAV